MARPKKACKCKCPDFVPTKVIFRPKGKQSTNAESIYLYHDELEVLYLCDNKKLSQKEAGDCMGISRGTVQRLLMEARYKVAEALVKQRILIIEAGERKFKP